MLNNWHWTDYILAAVGGIATFFTLKWIKNIFAGQDGKLNVHELKMMTSFLFFIAASIYMLHTEGTRPINSDHVFSDTWLFFVVGALLYVLGMDKFFVIIENFLKLLIQLRSKTPLKEENKPSENETP